MNRSFEGPNRRVIIRRNGDSHRLIWWLMGSMFAIILAMAGTWATKIDHSLDKIENKLDDVSADVYMLKERTRFRTR